MLPETPAKGLIFDMDGTIVDNMRYHDDAWEVWYRKYGLPFERATFSARTAGMAISDIIGPHFPGADAVELDRLAEEKEGLYRETYGPLVKPLGGLIELLDRALGYTWAALVTVGPDRSVPTPCADWSLADLLGHMDDGLDAFLEAAEGAVRVEVPRRPGAAIAGASGLVSITARSCGPLRLSSAMRPR